MIPVKIKALHPLFKLPALQSAGAAAWDLTYCGDRTVSLSEPGQLQPLPLGFAVELPRGFEIQLRPRSGLAANFGVTLLNSPGTIDSDYRGEVKALLIKLAVGFPPLEIKPGDRVCQMLISSTYTKSVDLILSDVLSETERGEGGFGSTGVT